MKKYLPIFIILLALCGNAQAYHNVWWQLGGGETLECTQDKCPGTYELAMSPVFLGASGGAGCSQATLFAEEDRTADAGILRTGRNYTFTSFVAASTDTARRVEVYVKKVGTPTACNNGQVAMCNFDTDANKCGTTCKDTDSTFDIATWPTDYAWIGYNISAGFPLTETTEYCVRIYCPNVEAFNTDGNWQYENSTGDYTGHGTDGVDYTTTANVQRNIRVKRCTE
jgi:hypothetical protein